MISYTSSRTRERESERERDIHTYTHTHYQDFMHFLQDFEQDILDLTHGFHRRG
jgi:hypothetical protein